MHTAFEDDIKKLCMSMTGRSTNLGCVGMAMSLLDQHTMVLNDYVKSSSFFENLNIYAHDNIILGKLGNYEPFKEILDLHVERECCTKIWSLESAG